MTKQWCAMKLVWTPSWGSDELCRTSGFRQALSHVIAYVIVAGHISDSERKYYNSVRSTPNYLHQELGKDGNGYPWSGNNHQLSLLEISKIGKYPLTQGENRVCHLVKS